MEGPKILEEEEIPAREGDEGGLHAFRLFGHSLHLRSIHRNALLLYHPAALDVENNPIYLKITGNAPLLESIKRGAYGFWYYAQEGFLPVESVIILQMAPQSGTKPNSMGQHKSGLVA